MPYKRRATICYTEVIFYNDNDEEMDRMRTHDDWTDDEGPREECTPDELADLFMDAVLEDDEEEEFQ